MKIGDSESSQDLKGQLAEGNNRIVVTQVDVCPPYNMLKSAKIEIKSNGGKTIVVASSAPIPLTSHGDVHVYTPDRLAYDFQATGEFLCCQSADKTIVVQSRQETWPRNPKVSVNTAAAVSVAGDKIEFYHQPGFRIYVNDKETDISSTLQLPEGGSIDSTLSGGSKQYIIIWPGGGFAARIVAYNNATMDVGIRRQVDKQALTGLFGNLDGDSRNDLQLRTGESITPPADAENLNRFGDSWRLKPDESLFGDTARDQALAAATKSPHTIVEIDAANKAEAEKAVRAAGITDPLAVSNWGVQKASFASLRIS